MDRNYVVEKFGNCNGFRLVNENIRSIILNKINGLKVKQVKPLIDKNLVHKCLISCRINKKISYILLTKFNNISFCYYITENNNIYATKQRFNFKNINDTLFSGYMLDGLFLVEDILIHKGETVYQPLKERLILINKLLDHDYCHDPILDNYKLIIKDYIEPKFLNSFINEYISTLSYRDAINGLYFNPLNSTTTIYYIDDLKLERQEQPSISDKINIVESPSREYACFLVKVTDKPDIYNLYLLDGKNIKYYDIASIPDNQTSASVKKMFAHDKEHIMICMYDKRQHIRRWKPVLISNRKSPDTINYISP